MKCDIQFYISKSLIVLFRFYLSKNNVAKLGEITGKTRLLPCGYPVKIH